MAERLDERMTQGHASAHWESGANITASLACVPGGRVRRQSKIKKPSAQEERISADVPRSRPVGALQVAERGRYRSILSSPNGIGHAPDHIVRSIGHVASLRSKLPVNRHAICAAADRVLEEGNSAAILDPDPDVGAMDECIAYNQAERSRIAGRRGRT